jgi:hypothetical protein
MGINSQKGWSTQFGRKHLFPEPPDEQVQVRIHFSPSQWPFPYPRTKSDLFQAVELQKRMTQTSRLLEFTKKVWSVDLI